MRTLVIYASKTGNTRKVAQAMAEELGAALVNVRKEKLPDLSDVGLILVGDGVYAWRPSRAMVKFLRRLPELRGLKAAVFGTYGGRPSQLDLLAKILTEKEAEVVDRFACPGRDWFALGLVQRGRPNENDLAAARAFARKLAAGKP